ncbi:hypothetical protein ASF84_12060 [Pseudomonas sp. Leaf127]|uniref:hypothetical protein n=1 Tax=Pseudomonas sp. Leaf127 TaxID=1736267 RepID=UPI000703647B|nr:hypothetical protein [Pseudomonas sp. Leaf127]KQQ56031.1 hypothetical protein ASF84_12060 [Pseudomonas sp. Leaf127]
MPVRLDQLPPLAPRSSPPRLWLWLALLGVLLLLGVGLLLMFAGRAWPSLTARGWGLALGGPLLLWSVLGSVRALLFMAEQRTADGWDQARETDRRQRIERGQRCLEVMAASVHTALREPADVMGTAQLGALLGRTRALKAQASRAGERAVRHSRLGRATARPADVLQQALTQVLADLAPALRAWPEQTPLALLLTFDSGLPEPSLQQAWQQAWHACGIRHAPVAVTGMGLEAVDEWLDRRPAEQTLWLVVALRLAPQPLDGSAEVAVGLLLGHRTSPPGLAPLARLHRPEQATPANAESGCRAARQALDWGATAVTEVAQVWCAGAKEQGAPNASSMLIRVLSDLDLLARHKDSLCDLDAGLGCTGQAAPWLAIACAAQHIDQGTGPQLIFSGTGAPDDGLWCTALTPVITLESSGV